MKNRRHSPMGIYSIKKHAKPKPKSKNPTGKPEFPAKELSQQQTSKRKGLEKDSPLLAKHAISVF